MNAPKGLVVDHKDGDTLNNQRDNLQIVTHAMNISTSVVRSDSKLCVKGVRQTRSGKFEANITINRKPHYLGTFTSLVEAARAYMEATGKRMFFNLMFQPLQQQQGGGGQAQQPTVPTPTAPASPNNAASLAVEQATFRQQLRRKSINSTITGAGGGYVPPAGSGPMSPGGNGPMTPPVK